MDLATITRSIEDVAAASKAAGAEVTAKIAEILGHTSTANARILDLEQKILTRGTPGPNLGDGAINIGAMIAGDAKLAALLKGDSQKFTIPINKGLRTIYKSILGNAGATGGAFEYAGIPELVAGGPRGFRGRRLRVLEAIPVIPVSTAESAVPKLENWADSSAMQGLEGALKGESTFNFVNATQRHQTVATYANISKQLLADQPMLIDFLNRVITYFVMRKLENLCVAGSGESSPDQFAGLLTQGIIFYSDEVHAADKIGSCITSLVALGYSPSLVILNPFDMFRIISERNTLGSYVAEGFGADMPSALWGINAVPSAALNSGTCIVADMSQVALLDREQAQILIGYQGSQFVENLATILAELRASLAVFDSHAVNILTLPTSSP